MHTKDDLWFSLFNINTSDRISCISRLIHSSNISIAMLVYMHRQVISHSSHKKRSGGVKSHKNAWLYDKLSKPLKPQSFRKVWLQLHFSKEKWYKNIFSNCSSLQIRQISLYTNIFSQKRASWKKIYWLIILSKLFKF